MKLARWWLRLTQPPKHVAEVSRRRKIQLLSGLLIVIFVVGFMATSLQFLQRPNYLPTFIVVNLGLLCLLVAYGLSRTGHYLAAALITVGSSVFVCFGIIILDPTRGVAYAYFGLSLVLASLLLAEKGLLIDTAIILLGITLGLPAIGVPYPNNDAFQAPTFLLMLAGLLFLFRRYLHVIEQDQQTVLAASEAQFRAFFEQAAVGVAQIDSQSGRFLRVNQRYCDITGYNREEICALSFQDITHPEDLPNNLEKLQQLIRGEIREFSFEKRYLRKAGGSVWVMLTVSPLWQPGEAPSTHITVVQDITDLKRAEENLLEIARGVSAATGALFFNSLVAHLAKSLGADYAFVAEIIPGSTDHMRTLAVSIQGESADNFEYALTGTPCASVVGKETCTYLHDVQSQFPDDRLLAEMGAEAYVGTPLFDTAGAGLGLIVALYRQPITHQAQIVTTLNIFAARAAAEIERLRSDEILRHSEAQYRTIVETTQEGVWQIDAENVTSFVNHKMADMLGYTVETMVGRSLFDFMDEEGKTIAARNVERRRQGVTEQHEFKFLCRDGTPLWTQLNTGPLFDHEGQYAGAIAMVTDITEHRRAEARMRQLSSALEQTADSVLITDMRGIIEYANPAFAQITGYALTEILGQNPRLVKSGQHDAAFYQKLWQTILAGEIYNEVIINRRKDGRFYYEEKTITPLKDAAGHITHFVSTGKDVSERMHAQQQLTHMAQHDALTELPNRILLLDRLNQAISRARWHKRIVAVLFVDLDRFKTINDTLGHDTGDLLLQQLAARFSACVREGDTVARFGGDEFVILLDDVANEGDIRSLATKVLGALAPTFEIAQQRLYITASIGVSLYPNDGEDASTLLKHADVAMYRAKELGKNTYQFYSADMSARAFERLTLESSLRHALERGELRLFYQPVIDLRNGSICSVEALLRWQHPDFGLVLPNDFIAVLEDTSLIVPAGEWVLATACAQLDAWHQQGWPALRLAVNLSPRQFQGGDLMRVLQPALALLHCPPSQLELEITESMLMQQSGGNLQMLDALHALGVCLAIDDFGTGYSSLSYLRRFPVDTLKIDRSFVRDIPGDPDDSAITTAITVLAQSLKLSVIAEGVENEAQRDFLSQLGCHLMQGYLFSKPLPPEEITHLLETRNPRT
ncbi:MAG: PAS domain S-box protein [Burkholderiales bacterium]|nr:PAS domain S-box protein [Burkholderiales bacterium]